MIAVVCPALAGPSVVPADLSPLLDGATLAPYVDQSATVETHALIFGSYHAEQ